ncbi:N/A [soil metagenome]
MILRKRLFDVLIGVPLAVLATPLIVFGAIGASVALGSWQFFVQQRVGRGGRTFRFVKVRTLPISTPPYADKYELADVDVPRFCQHLRRLHLDELPQLFLVVTGHMSLVGPRPEMPWLHRQLDQEFATARTRLRPGCTGLWQVGRACDRLITEAPGYDEFYLRHQSLRLDVYLLYRTLRLLVAKGPTLKVDEVPLWVRRSRPLPVRRSAVEPAFNAVDA